MLPKAIRVPLDKLDENLSRIPKDKQIVAYCTWPNQGSNTSLAQKLLKLGYKDVGALQGGFGAWQNAGSSFTGFPTQVGLPFMSPILGLCPNLLCVQWRSRF
jgi:3-mercaptopyruvate sulfurtransferase SseA